MAKLEDLTIKDWLRKDTRFDAKGDGNCLYLRYRQTDNKPVWFFRYKIEGIEHKVFIGRYPDMSLATARRQAVILRGELLKGENPAADKKEAKQKRAAKAIADQSAQTVSELVDDYFIRHIDGKCKTAKAIRGRVNRYLIPAIGKLRIDAVKPLNVSNMLDSIVNGGAPTTANDILTLSKQIFNHAIKRHIITSNPAFAFNFKDAGGQEKARTRYLNKDELTKLLEAMRSSNKFTDYHAKVAKLLLLLGCRKGELFKAKRADFDLDAQVWHMPSDNKTESAIDIPLSSPALAIIKELMQYHINDYLIPSQGGNKGHIDDSYLNKPLKALSIGIAPFTIHDLRSTMRTHLTKLGIDPFVAERCLNHKIPGMAGVYDRGDYFNERRTALDLWADFLIECGM